MTLFPSIPGLEAVVVVGGVDAHEYEVPEDDENPLESLNLADYDAAYARHGNIPHVVRYIEAKPGVDFLYRVTIKPNFVWRSHHVGVQVRNDGVKGGLRRLFQHQTAQDGSIVENIRSRTSGNSKEGYMTLMFRFAPVSLVESDSVTPSQMQLQMKTAKQCGCLKVFLFRMQKGKKFSVAGKSPAAQPPPQATQFSEKAFKGRAIDCVSSFIAKPLRTDPTTKYSKNYTDDQKHPFAVFEFRYRSKEGLMTEGIIPRPPQVDDFEALPERKPVKREGAITIDDAGINGSQTVPGRSALEQVNGMSDDEVRRKLAELLDQRNPGNRPMKRENPMDDAEFSARYKTRKLNNGRVEIDLTDD
ncbi:hypothetical protein QBC42DRAFT_26312 [Cladorrhinum samala]|uniref:DUF7918 domain-containing protein n=1 Tax=Cladorrhinum samala TaxID=585594 RepID=A0AAV9I1F9_9PEZI|nr:hypothetical protein QBC42DRAFT_26312 [Cladorrhinum samala]